MPRSRNIDSMPNVRASSGIIGTMYLLSSGYFSRAFNTATKRAGGGGFAAARALQRFV